MSAIVTTDAEYPKIVEMIRDVPADQIEPLLRSMDPAELAAVTDSWDLWQLPYQQLPAGDWRRWYMQVGRGGGKTYAGAKITNEVARDRKKIRTGEIGIMGRTYAQTVRDLIEGPSGILRNAPPDFRPKWWPGKGLLEWPNKIRGWVLSGDTSETALGLNLAWLWGDEFAVWPDPETAVWEHIEPALRIGWARSLYTSTPKPNPFLRKLVQEPDTVVTRGSTYNNPFLAPRVRDAFRRVYEGTRRGREQLMGEILDDLNGALWMQSTIDNHRVSALPQLRRVLIAVDPAGGDQEENDEAGIVAVGVDDRDQGYVLADASGKYGATEWPHRAIALYHYFRADGILGEVNFGGDLVEAAVRAVDQDVPFYSVRASRGKMLRAEPVAALYEQGRVHHFGRLPDLERQQTEWIPNRRMKSPDRVDAVVHGLTALMLDPANIGSGSIDAYL